MRALIGEATRRGLGLNLSVRSENPARRLYERLGFRDIPGSAFTNRAGGISIGMALRLRYSCSGRAREGLPSRRRRAPAVCPGPREPHGCGHFRSPIVNRVADDLEADTAEQFSIFVAAQAGMIEGRLDTHRLLHHNLVRY